MIFHLLAYMYFLIFLQIICIALVIEKKLSAKKERKKEGIYDLGKRRKNSLNYKKHKRIKKRLVKLD